MSRAIRHTREYNGNRYNLVRDCVQNQRPFVVYNFTDPDQYNKVLADLDAYGKLSYVLQVIHSIENSGYRMKRSFPSIFVTNYDTEVTNDEFKNMAKGSIKHYNLDSLVCLYDGGVSVFYKNGDSHPIGDTIYASTTITDFLSDFYQIEGVYYSFVS
jgi:hypothetical protein